MIQAPWRNSKAIAKIVQVQLCLPKPDCCWIVYLFRPRCRVQKNLFFFIDWSKFISTLRTKCVVDPRPSQITGSWLYKFNFHFTVGLRTSSFDKIRPRRWFGTILRKVCRLRSLKFAEWSVFTYAILTSTTCKRDLVTTIYHRAWGMYTFDTLQRKNFLRVTRMHKVFW